MDFSSEKFSELVKKAISGDEDSLNELCSEIAPFLTYYLSYSTGDNLRAKLRIEDLLNEVLEKVLEGMPGFKYQSPIQFKHWLQKVCDSHLNETARFFNAKKRNTRDQVSLNLDIQGEELGEILAGSGTSPSSALLRDERKTLVRQVLSGLKDEYRTVLELKFYRRLSSAEMAVQLGTTPGAVRGRLLRATREFTREFREFKKQIDPDSTVFK